jgi:hypothetical protein
VELCLWGFREDTRLEPRIRKTLLGAPANRQHVLKIALFKATLGAVPFRGTFPKIAVLAIVNCDCLARESLVLDSCVTCDGKSVV